MNAFWALQDAKAKFSEVTRRALRFGPQHVTVRGQPAIVVLSEAEFQRLTGRSSKPTLADLFRSHPFEFADLDLERSRETSRTIDL